MSKPAPAPGKPNYLSTALFMVAAFLLFKMFFDPQKNQPTAAGKPLTNSAQVLTELQRIDAADPKTATEANANYAPVDQLIRSYRKFVDEDVEAKKATQAEGEDLKTKASILTAHIQIKDGLVLNDTNKLRTAYNTLEPLARNEGSKPIWNSTPIEVKENGTTVAVTGHQLHDDLVAKISARNRSDLIWGAIPGGYAFIDFLVGLTGHNPNYSYAFATLLLAFVVRAVVFPLSQKQLMTSRKMTQLAPRLLEIKEKFKDDQIEMNKRSMELYARFGVSPFAGCLPALVQMPLFLTVYQCILHYQFEFTKGYFLWINPGSSAATNGFFAPNLGQQDYLLIIIYGVSMVISTLLTPVSDPSQAKQQRIMGIGVSIIFPVMMLLRLFPVVSGFVLYWTFTNLFSMAQSIRAYRMPMPELVEVNAPGGGVYAGKPKGRWAQMMEEMQVAAQEQQKAQKGDKPDDGPPEGGSAVRVPKDKGPQGGGSFGGGKISPSRPVGETGSANNGSTAKHKPKKRK